MGHRQTQLYRHKRRSKLRNKSVHYDGYRFASKLEAAIYLLLKARVLHGEMEILKHQGRVRLTDANIIYVPDFMCRDLKTNEIFFVEAKGFETPDWKIKKKLWSVYGPAPLQIWQGTYKRPFLTEILTPAHSSKI